MLTNHRKLFLASFGVGCAFGAALSARPWPATNARPRPTAFVEKGTFRLHKFEQPIGEEKYSVQPNGDELQLSVTFHFNDRGQDVPLDAYLRVGRDLVPLSMEIHGYVARGTPIDDSGAEGFRRGDPGRKNLVHRPAQQNIGAQERHDTGCHRQDDCAWPLGYARALRTSRMGAGVSRCRGHHCPRLRQRIRIHHRRARGHQFRPRRWPAVAASWSRGGSAPIALGVARVDTPEQAREWVHGYHDAGFQQIKIYSSVKKENLEVVTTEAHKLGMTVTGHIPEGLNAFDGVTAGMDQINHISYIVRTMAPEIPGRSSEANRTEVLRALRNFDPDSESSRKVIEFLRSHGTVVDPTLAVFEMFQRTGRKPLASFEPGVAKVAPALATQLRNVGRGSAGADLGEARFAASLKAVAALHRAGVPIVVGTDQTVPGHSVHREMELYVQAGFTPMEALQAATMVPARVMGVEKEAGTLEPGKRADLVILGADPLEDIGNIRRTETVIQGGVVYDCAALWRSVGFQP